ncbi:hypothetical protein Tco_0750219 [Tanacetum coccineum]|uniref:Uncharacterized protein n=1 Tax=Tanacetum coccineum TaxID=301880 RepID=A0ABQ4Z499_9ASTR
MLRIFFSSTHSLDYISALSDYSLASPGNTSLNFSDDLTKDLLSSLSISPFDDDLHLNYLDELSFHRIEKMEEGRTNGNELKTELKRIRTQIIKLQRKKLGQKDKIAFAHYRISDLEQIIKEIQARHQTDQEDL